MFAIAATGGDDYEILASVAPARAQAFEAAALHAGVAVRRIGKAIGGNAVRFFGESGAEMTFENAAYSHF